MRPTAGFVYVLECGGYHKVGWSGDPKKRAKGIQTGSPFPVTLIGFVPGTRDDEAAWHEAFADKRVQSEWFRLTPEDVALVLEDQHAKAVREVCRILGPRLTRRISRAS